jgi:ELWxxDGT repeat protein
MTQPRLSVARWRRLTGGLVSVVVLTVAVAASASPAAASTAPYLVKNINKSGGSFPALLTVVGDRLFFIANDGVHGSELWVSDGTAAGTSMVKDITPTNDADGPPYSLTAIGDVLYFNADDGVHGRELWVSDGTEAGTRMVFDLPGTSTSGYPLRLEPYGFTAFNGLVYFSGAGATSGRELWRTDGTETGTFQVVDLAAGSAGSNPDSIVAFAGKLYFLRHENGSCGVASVLYRTDGTAAGTKPMRNASGNKIKGGFPNHCLARGALWPTADHLFFGRTRTELWSTDGTAASTHKVGDPGTRDVVDLNGNGYFAFRDGTSPDPNSGLWGSDGTAAGTGPIFDVAGQPLSGSYADGFLTSAGGRLFYFAEGLTVSDGTDAGTHNLGVPVIPNGWGPIDTEEYGPPLPSIGPVLYFVGHTIDHEGQDTPMAIWRSDGTTAGTYAATPGFANGIGSTRTVGNSVFFVTQASKGMELWRFVP